MFLRKFCSCVDSFLRKSKRIETNDSVMKIFVYSLLVAFLLIDSIASRSFVWFTSTAAPQINVETIDSSALTVVHLTVKEKSYSPEEKYLYIQSCVDKCLAMRSKDPAMFGRDRDSCIQQQCRIYQRRRRQQS